jgi:hypothetical protein
MNKYSPEEYAPAVPAQGPLNWNSGQPFNQPLNPPTPDTFGRAPVPVPRMDQGQRSGVDAIIGAQDGGER